MSTNYFKEVLKVLEQLHKDHPSFSIGRHLATALSDYGDIWGISNKEMLFALNKYQAELELDHPHLSHDDYVNKIIKDGMDLDNILRDEEDDD